jgi:mRNA interferase HigB
VNVITRRRLREWARWYPDARSSLAAWYAVTRKARWQSIVDVREDFPTADGVVVGSGRVVTVFNIRGNKYRMITAIHYNRQRVYLLRFLTHADYDKGDWKGQL